MDYQNLYAHLIDDVRQLKMDFETLAATGGFQAGAYWDAADMTKYVLEKDETRTHNE